MCWDCVQAEDRTDGSPSDLSLSARSLSTEVCRCLLFVRLIGLIQSRLAFLETENSALQVRVTTLEGISTSSSAPLSDLAHHHQPPSPPLQHPATPLPEFRPLPSPSPTAMHPSPSPLSSDQLAGSDPLSSLNATLLSDQQGSVGTTLSYHPRAGTPPPPPASGHECVTVSTSNSFGPLASLAAVDTDQTTPTPSPDVQQTRASPDLNESGKGKPSTKGQDVTDLAAWPPENNFSEAPLMTLECRCYWSVTVC